MGASYAGYFLPKGYLVLVVFTLMSLPKLHSQDFNHPHKTELMCMDSSARLCNSIYFYSVFTKSIFKKYPYAYIKLIGSAVIDSFEIKKINRMGKCKFKPSVWDTLQIKHLVANRIFIEFIVKDSFGKSIVYDTLQVSKINVPRVNLYNQFTTPTVLDKFDFKGSVSNETRYSTANFGNQDLPAFYTRTQVTLALNTFGLPLNVNYFISSENNYSQDLNNLQVSLNVEELKSNLEKKKKNLYSYSIPNSEELSLPKANPKNLGVLAKNKINTGIQDSLGKIKNLAHMPPNPNIGGVDTLGVRNSISDSILKIGNKYKLPTNPLDRKTDSLAKLAQLNKLVDLTNPNLDGFRNKLGSNTLRDSLMAISSSKRLDLNKYEPNYLKVLENLRKFEAGNVILNYSPIWANGINLKGAVLGFEHKQWQLSTFAGLQKRVLNEDPKQLGTRRIGGAQIQYSYQGLIEFSFGYLYGADAGVGFLAPESNQLSFIPQRNQVLNARLHFTKNSHDISIELSKSQSTQLNSSSSLEINCSKKPINFLPGTASIFQYKFQIKPTRTDIAQSYTYVNSSFESFGLYYMRKSFGKYELRIKQTLLKKVQLTGVYRTSASVGSELTGAKMKNQSYSMQAGINFKHALKRVSIIGLHNTFHFYQIGDTLQTNTQQMLAASCLWQFPVPRRIYFSSAWNYSITKNSNSDKITLNQNASLSNSFKWSRFLATNELSYLEVLDSINQQQANLILGYSLKFITLGIGAKTYSLNWTPSNNAYLIQLDTRFKKTQAGIKIEYYNHPLVSIQAYQYSIQNGLVLSLV